MLHDTSTITCICTSALVKERLKSIALPPAGDKFLQLSLLKDQSITVRNYRRLEEIVRKKLQSSISTYLIMICVPYTK